MNTSEFAQPLYPTPDAGPGAAVRPRRSVPDDDPLAETDARGQAVAGDRLPASRAAQQASTGPQRRAQGRSRPDPAAGSGRRIREAGSAAVAEPADPARADPVPADRAIARAGPGQRDRAAGDGDSAEIQVLDRQRQYRGKPPRKPGKSGGPKPRKQAAPGKSRPRAGLRGARKVLVLAGSVIVAVLAVAAYVVFKPQPSHAVSTPVTLGSYARQQANATAKALKQRILAAAAGDVKNVVAAVYERTTGPGTSTGSQIVVFIGGNLAGNASASGLISAYMTRLHGAFATSAGQLGGQAACAPGSNGGPAECAWADSDTFGVVVSATLTSAGLADEMRQMRPLVEHVVR